MAGNLGNIGELILSGVQSGIASYERGKERKLESKREKDSYELQKKAQENEAERIKAQEKYNQDHLAEMTAQFKEKDAIALFSITARTDVTAAKSMADLSAKYTAGGMSPESASQLAMYNWNLYQGAAGVPATPALQGAQQGSSAAPTAPAMAGGPPLAPSMLDAYNRPLPEVKAKIDQSVERTIYLKKAGDHLDAMSAVDDMEREYMGAGVEQRRASTEATKENTDEKKKMEPLRERNMRAAYKKTMADIEHVSSDDMRKWRLANSQILLQAAEAKRAMAAAYKDYQEGSRAGLESRGASPKLRLQLINLQKEASRSTSEARDKYQKLKLMATPFHEIGYAHVKPDGTIDRDKLSPTAKRAYDALVHPAQGQGMDEKDVAKVARTLYDNEWPKVVDAFGYVVAARKQYNAATAQLIELNMLHASNPDGSTNKKKTDSLRRGAVSGATREVPVAPVTPPRDVRKSATSNDDPLGILNHGR